MFTGLSQTAAILQSEAGLPRSLTPTHPESPYIYATSASNPSTPKLVCILLLRWYINCVKISFI